MTDPVVDLLRRRINEVTHFISEAERTYFDPEKFRINLNSAIQSSRNVTFALQSSKKDISNFDEWYSVWRRNLESEPLLKWLVRARNQITKQGDLKLNSVLRVGLVLSYYDHPQKEYSGLPLRLSVSEIIRRIKLPPLPRDVLEDAYVRIERRWVSNDLPDRELLQILEYAVHVLEAMLVDLGRHMSGKGEEEAFFPKPPKADAMISPRALMVRLKDGSISRSMSKQAELPQSEAELTDAVLKRYGYVPEGPDKDHPGGRLRALAEWCMKEAERVLRKDGYHQTIAMLLSDRGESKIARLEFRDDAEKYLVWRGVADDVRKYGATEVVVISESWLATYDTKAAQPPYVRASKAPDKEEALSVVAISKAGEEICLVRQFTRTGSGFEFGDVIDESGGANYHLEPIREVWGLPRYNQIDLNSGGQRDEEPPKDA